MDNQVAFTIAGILFFCSKAFTKVKFEGFLKENFTFIELTCWRR